MIGETKACPFCAETIEAAAKVCQHCGRDLEPKLAQQKKQQGWGAGGRILILVALCLVLFFVFLPRGDPPSEPVAPTTYNVEYRLSGSAESASVTLENAQGHTELKDVSIPWQPAGFEARSGQLLYISAQNNGWTGSITCEILVDGQPWQTTTSIGEFAITSCSGLAGE